MKSKCRINAGGIKAQLTPTDCTFGPIKNNGTGQVKPNQAKPKFTVNFRWPKRTESQSNQDQDHFDLFQFSELGAHSHFRLSVSWMFNGTFIGRTIIAINF